MLMNIKRPSLPGIDEAEARIHDIQEMEAAVKGLKTRLRALGPEIIAQADSVGIEELVNAVNYIYWFVPELSCKSLPKEIKALIDVTLSSIECERCKRPVILRNRAHLLSLRQGLEKDGPRYAEGYRILCDDCEKEVYAERHKQYKQENTERLARMEELCTMPYAEYLKTPEWQGRRKQHLRSAGYRCQVCNAYGVVLNVHHRTYERRGCEYYKDLIALCAECHELFHISSKLAD